MFNEMSFEETTLGSIGHHPDHGTSCECGKEAKGDGTEGCESAVVGEKTKTLLTRQGKSPQVSAVQTCIWQSSDIRRRNREQLSDQ